MATIRQLEQALLAADAAGDTESAQILAMEIHKMMAPPAVEAPAPKPQMGFIPALKAGKENIIGDIYAGLAGLGMEGAEAKARAQKEKAAAIYQQPEFAEHPWEYLKGLAGQSIPYMAAPFVAGAAATPLGELAAMGAAGAASAAQFTGSNLARQLEEGKTGAQLETGKAAAAAIPQAALDIVGFRFIPGIRTFFNKAGIPITEEAAQSIAGRYILPAAKTAGVEGATEAGQQVFERLQAGLSITDPEARKEYFDNFLGGAVLGGALAVPGTMLEGRRKPETAAPEAPPPPPSITEEPTPPPPPPTLAAPEQLALAGPAKAPQLGYTPQAAPQEPQPHVATLMEQHQELQKQLDPLAEKIEAARKAGDHDAARALTKEYRDNEASLNTLKTKITDLGGFLGNREEVEAEHAKAVKTIDAKIAKLQNAVTENSRADVRDYDAVDKAEQQIEKLKQERAKTEEELKRKQDILRVTETPKNEQIPLFEKQEEPIKTPLVFESKADGKFTAADIEQRLQGPVQATGLTKDQEAKIAAKKAEADDLYKQVVAASTRFTEEGKQIGGPQLATTEQKQAVVNELNALRQKYRALQEAEGKMSDASAQANYYEAHDAAKASTRTRINELESALERMVPANVKNKYLKDYYAKVTKLNQLHDEIDALHAAPVAQTTKIMDLFDYGNQIRTATLNKDHGTLMKLLKQLKDEGKVGKGEAIDRAKNKIAGKEKKGASERDKLMQVLGKRMGYKTTISERTVTEEEYDQIAARITELMDMIDKPKGRAKESIKDKVDRLEREIAGLDETLKNKSLPAQTRQGASKSRNVKVKEYNHLVENVMVPARDEIFALYRSMYTVREEDRTQKALAYVTDEAEKTRKEKIKEFKERVDMYGEDSPQVREFVEKNLAIKMSPEYKRYKKVIEGKNITSSPKKVAMELGQSTNEYKAFAEPKQKEIEKRKNAYEKYEKDAKAELAKLKAELGEGSEDYKHRVSEYTKTAKQKLDAWKNAEKALNKALETKAVEIGKAHPDYRSKKLEATKKYKETVATTGEQEVETRRTGQATRKVAKLSNMQTGSTESRERTNTIQEKQEPGLLPTQGKVTTEERAKPKAEPKSSSAIFEAFQAAAAKRIKETGAFRTGKAGEGVVDPTEAKGRIVEIKSRLPKGMNLIYEPTLADMKQETLDMLKADGYKEGTPFKGVVLGDGTIVVVGDQHANMTDLEETLYHEMVGHYGIDTVIGLDRLQKYALDTDLEKLAKDLGGMPLWIKALDAMTFAKEQKGDPDLAALREIIAYTAQQRVTESFYAKASRFIKELIGMMRDALRSMGFKNMAAMSSNDVFKAIKSADTAYQNRTLGPYRAADGVIAFRSKQEPASIAPSFVAKNPSEVDRLKANFLGLTGRVQFVDQYAALSEALKKGVDSKKIAALEAEQAEYYLRFGQQRSQYAGQFLTNGPVSLVKQETKRGKEFIYKSSPGANMMQVADALAPSKIGNDTEKEAILTALLAGERAKQVGWAKLNFDNPAKVEQEYNQIKALLNSRPQDKAMFDKAMEIYKQYNNGLLDFLVQTGTMTEKKAAELKAITYVPFYRVNKGTGEIELMVDKEHPVRIGNIKDEPQLKELVGDSTQILPVFTSSVQNTFMLTEMALRNQMVKENAFMLNKVGIASTIGKGTGPAGSGTVRFKHEGDDHFVVIDKDLYDIPASLIVKGMEGIKTTIPAAVRMLGMPADILRKFVTRNPAYAIKQAIRDPLTAWMTTGVDGVPVLNSMKELSSMVARRSEAEKKLMEAGAISSNVFTGDKGDMETFLKEISMGRSGWQKLMARADAFALQGDAATRAVLYKDSINKGMSEMQAMLRTLESMNFSRRGLSPSMQMASVLIPFFNAQIQGLDVLYRAFTGKMPYDQQLEIRKKMLARGLMLAAGTIAYAAMMEDDEAYKKAKPEERLGNWFLPTPFSDEPLRIPVPFELGYLFKSLPEAVYNMAAADERNSDITKGMSKLVMQSNPFSLPQAIKPATEAYLGKSFFGGDIESQREIHSMVPTERYRTSTTEIAKMVGSVTGDAGFTPIKLDYLIRGYTGGLGIALVSLANPVLNTETSETRTKKTHELPFVGGLFQPIEGRGTLDAAYERMLEIQQAKGTYDSLIQRGKKEEALAFRDEYIDKISSASVSGTVQQKLGELAKLKRQVESAPNMSTERKDEILKRLDAQQNNLADRFLRISDRTTRLAAQP